ncbi:MAG: hypothetical protein L3K08_05670, partial [Thermoplasmata archaeon]|nr:hypothetical protein [Thermoplasmata archaeon]
MTSGPFGWVVGFISDPRWGIPYLLLLEATILWVAWNPRAPTLLGARRISWTRPEGDAVSRMYYALQDQRYSVIVRWSRERIEELYVARSGVRLPTLPWTLRRRSPIVSDPYNLRRLTQDLGNFEWEAREREVGVHLRWAFWRTRQRDSALYEARV